MNEQALAEIRALAHERDRRIRDMLEQLEEIKHGRAANGDQPIIAFVHIPKTAGGALTTMFVNAYSRTGVYDTGNYVSGPEKALGKITRKSGSWESWQRRGGRIAIGHTPYGLLGPNLPADTRYVTLLREPVDRVLSHYYRHIHREGLSDVERGPRQRERAGSLEEALVEMRLPALCNLSTRLLCSHPTLETLPPSALDEAKENLRSFAFVGIQERFEESVVLLQRMLGLGPVPYVDKHVSRPGQRPSVDEISDEDRALVLEHNQFDAELYALGRELFEQSLAVAQDDVAAAVERLRDATTAAAGEHDAAVEAARAWLDRELPPGGIESMRDLVDRAEAAGHSRAALTEARQSLLVVKHKTDTGRHSFKRVGSASLTPVDDATAWLERELPAGTSRPRDELFEGAEAAGLTRTALNRARGDLSVDKVLHQGSGWVWSRRPARA